MLVNFALGCVGTEVSCDKVSTDGYECTNLVSSNWQERQKGFIAEHFIKPPVNITFSFPCSIQVYKIFVTPHVGQQLTSIVEIYSASKNSRYKNRTKNSTTMSSSASPTGIRNSCSDCSLTDDNVPLFYQISKVSVPNFGRICFTNPKFNSQTSNTDMTLTEDESLCSCKAMLQHFRREILTSSSHLSVRLVQTRHGSSVAMGGVDIWGVPAYSVTSCVKDEVLSKFMSFIRPKPLTSQTKTRKDDVKSSKEKHQQEQELSMPEEFIDPLTCEVMSIPMLLPSGKNVDKSSLDRFSSSEEVYGRAPRDPFTGVVFSNNSQPVPNIALKSRIDQFLFKHRDNKATSSVARTVNGHSGFHFLGKRDGDGRRVTHGISSLVALSSNSNSVSPLSNNIHFHAYNYKPSLSNSITKPSQNALLKQNNDCDLSSNKSAASPSNTTKPAAACKESPFSKDYKSHEHKLKESLSSALTSLLGNSSSTQSTNSNSASDECVLCKCSSCKKSQSKTDVVYNSPCSHTICRQCLTMNSSSVIICGLCGKRCQHEDFIRKHHI